MIQVMRTSVECMLTALTFWKTLDRKTLFLWRSEGAEISMWEEAGPILWWAVHLFIKCIPCLLPAWNLTWISLIRDKVPYSKYNREQRSSNFKCFLFLKKCQWKQKWMHINTIKLKVIFFTQQNEWKKRGESTPLERNPDYGQCRLKYVVCVVPNPVTFLVELTIISLDKDCLKWIKCDCF